jgi:hypothetical protein
VSRAAADSQSPIPDAKAVIKEARPAWAKVGRGRYLRRMGILLSLFSRSCIPLVSPCIPLVSLPPSSLSESDVCLCETHRHTSWRSLPPSPPSFLPVPLSLQNHTHTRNMHTLQHTIKHTRSGDSKSPRSGTTHKCTQAHARAKLGQPPHTRAHTRKRTHASGMTPDPRCIAAESGPSKPEVDDSDGHLGR